MAKVYILCEGNRFRSVEINKKRMFDNAIKKFLSMPKAKDWLVRGNGWVSKNGGWQIDVFDMKQPEPPASDYPPGF